MTMQYGCVALFEDTHISERRSVGSKILIVRSLDAFFAVYRFFVVFQGRLLL